MTRKQQLPDGSIGWVDEISGVRVCEATRYDPRPCEGPPRFDVIYRVGNPRREHDRHPACFRHGLAEVDRHHASGAMSEIEMVEMEQNP